jgi:hypothetical protein
MGGLVFSDQLFLIVCLIVYLFLILWNIYLFVATYFSYSLDWARQKEKSQKSQTRQKSEESEQAAEEAEEKENEKLEQRNSQQLWRQRFRPHGCPEFPRRYEEKEEPEPRRGKMFGSEPCRCRRPRVSPSASQSDAQRRKAHSWSEPKLSLALAGCDEFRTTPLDLPGSPARLAVHHRAVHCGCQ